MDDLLDIAVRAWTPSRKPPRRSTLTATAEPRVPERLLIIDTETTTDETQRLNFGAYRYCRVTETDGEITLTCLQEGLFYADDLPERDPAGYEALKRYAASHTAGVDRDQIDAVPVSYTHLRSVIGRGNPKLDCRLHSEPSNVECAALASRAL